MKKISLITVIVVILAMIFAGCGSTTSNSESTDSVTAESVSLKTAGSTSVGPVMEALAEMYSEKYPNVEITVEAGGSGVGVTSCGDGTVDFGMASRDLKDEETEAYPDMETTVLCMDGVAVVVNSDNTVTDLTIDQIKDIFTGVITDWSEVGGTAGAIGLYTRDQASGTREAFQNLMLGKDDAGEQIEIDETLFSGVFDSNGALATAVQGDPNGIGYMSLGIVSNYKGIFAVDIGGVAATVDNMSNGTYAYLRPFNLLTMGSPEGAVADLFSYMTTDADAIAYMEEKGYVMP